MLLAPRHHSTAADLLRLLALWLALLLAGESMAAASALGLGPLHRHDAAAAGLHAHHHHDTAERHHHGPEEPGLVTVGEPDADIDRLAFAITAALALMALGALRAVPDPRRHEQRPGTCPRWQTAVLPLPLKPPRRA